jgi:hypothetical protein
MAALGSMAIEVSAKPDRPSHNVTRQSWACTEETGHGVGPGASVVAAHTGACGWMHAVLLQRALGDQRPGGAPDDSTG